MFIPTLLFLMTLFFPPGDVCRTAFLVFPETRLSMIVLLSVWFSSTIP
jgi:hypothetical protein